MKITILGKTREYEEGTSLFEISKKVEAEYAAPIMLAMVNGKLKELRKTPKDGDVVEFVTMETENGIRTYRRGIILVFMKALYKVLGSKGLEKVRIEHTIGNGIYGELEGDVILCADTFALVKQEMERIVAADMPFDKRVVNTEEAQKIFREHRMFEKEKLFGYRRVSKTNIYSLGGFEDYFYGYMPASTGVLKLFDLFPYDKGFILLVPAKEAPLVLPEFKERRKFFDVLQEGDRWGRIMGVETVGDINTVLANGGLQELILVQEAFMEKKIADIAAQIKSRGNVKFVMIAGPSSSGKTTFSHRLSIQLKTLGMKPHPIAVDDYFVNREDTPKHPDGSYNFECLGAIDVERFNKDMIALLEGGAVELPTFNFKTGRREYKGNVKKLGPEDILVIEGIHGLNDALSYKLPTESKFKIYISALTQLNIDEHNRIPTTDARMLRRIVRDARTRGAAAVDTIRMWPSVRKGEEENIFPFQESADVMFNSALIYELVLIKQFAEPLLFCVPKDAPEYVEAKRLLKFLDYFLGADCEAVPKNSIIREFIGGSCFKV
ncbi:MAG: nucleoside kinase [Lachnospiraceae bacterium]|nr:nucleoside kinase [Lachnospiraceae bacterium]